MRILFPNFGLNVHLQLHHTKTFPILSPQNHTQLFSPFIIFSYHNNQIQITCAQINMLDELRVESYRIPWLIWIQLIILFLLLALFYFFTVLDSDHRDATTATHMFPEIASTTAKGFFFDEIQQIDKPLITNHHSTAPVSTYFQQQISQGEENLTIKGEIGTCSSLRGEEIMEGESSTLNFHPCHYFQLATIAFLKCFGLDSTFDSSSNRKRRKRKES
ncbi:uncharacterized protein [Cicer arietinum]|uniref:Uncharacterized protein LOC101491685 isoform X2 n=1 Tax=Cicer arietinum TaxID=3827 RepID=A0A1S2YCK7_CICAR|nr:uncharacterized protein LOC101491685 isoform X2 [Cicer arietinum]